MQAATAIVAHAGMGTILTALEMGKPLLVMPRRAALGEHRNDHQLATASRFAELGRVKVAFSTKPNCPEAARAASSVWSGAAVHQPGQPVVHRRSAKRSFSMNRRSGAVSSPARRRIAPVDGPGRPPHDPQHRPGIHAADALVAHAGVGTPWPLEVGNARSWCPDRWRTTSTLTTIQQLIPAGHVGRAPLAAAWPLRSRLRSPSARSAERAEPADLPATGRRRPHR